MCYVGCSNEEDMKIFRAYIYANENVTQRTVNQSLGYCIIRQSSNLTLDMQFQIRSGEHVVVFTPLFHPDKVKVMTVEELSSMDFQNPYSLSETDETLRKLHNELRQPEEYESILNIKPNSDENFLTDEEREVLPKWLVNACKIANAMQYELSDLPDKENNIRTYQELCKKNDDEEETGCLANLKSLAIQMAVYLLISLVFYMFRCSS